MSVFDLHVVISLKKVNKLWNWEKVFCLVCEIEKGRIFRKRKTAHNTIVRKRASKYKYDSKNVGLFIQMLVYKSYL